MKIHDLYTKVSEFEAKISSSAMEKSQCRAGCSQCCYTDISVFSIEMDNIREWFQSLNVDEQAKLREVWKIPSESRKNFHGDEVKACAFLSNERCTIYEARPLICRTQGLALSFKEGQQTYMDICPLNEEMIDLLADNEVLNLDLLNTVLVSLEKLHQGDSQGERTDLSALRVELSSGNI